MVPTTIKRIIWYYYGEFKSYENYLRCKRIELEKLKVEFKLELDLAECYNSGHHRENCIKHKGLSAIKQWILLRKYACPDDGTIRDLRDKLQCVKDRLSVVEQELNEFFV